MLLTVRFGHAARGAWRRAMLDGKLPPAPIAATPDFILVEVDVVRALSDKVPLVRAEGRTIHVGGRMATADARLVGHDGKLYAHGSTTCFVFDA